MTASRISIRQLPTIPLCDMRQVVHAALSAHSDKLVTYQVHTHNLMDPVVAVYVHDAETKESSSFQVSGTRHPVAALAMADNARIFIAENYERRGQCSAVFRSLVDSAKCELGDCTCHALLASPSCRDLFAILGSARAPTLGSLVVIEPDTMTVTSVVGISLRGSVSSTRNHVLSPDGRIMAMLEHSNNGCALVLVDLERRRLGGASIKVARGYVFRGAPPPSVSFSPDGTRLAFLLEPRTLGIFAVPLLVLLRTVPLDREVTNVCYLHRQHAAPNEALLVAMTGRSYGWGDEPSSTLVVLDECGRKLAQTASVCESFVAKLLVDKRGTVCCIGDHATRFVVE